MALQILGAVGAVVALFVVVATRPAQFRIERPITVAAPPERAFVQVNDFRTFAESPGSAS